MRTFGRKIFFCSAVVLVSLLIVTVLRKEQEIVSTATADQAPIIETSSEWVAIVQTINLEEGIRLAKARGERMQALMRSNPEQAILEAFSLSEWSELPPEIQEHVETPFSALASIEVLIACGADESHTSISTKLPGTGTLETFVYGRRNSQATKNGIPVQGIHIDGVGALREEIFQSLSSADEAAALQFFPVAISDPGGDSIAALAGGRIFYFKDQAAYDAANTRLAALEELPGPNSGAQPLFVEAMEETFVDGEINFDVLEELAFAASSAWTGAAHDMYVILVDFADRLGQPTDPVALSNSINTTVSQQILEMSYEDTHVVCAVNTALYTMPLGNAAYTNYNLLFNTATGAVSGVDFSPYETICVFHPAIDGSSYAGLASVGGRRMWLKSSSTKTITHELGHNYGAKHSDSWNPVGNNPIDPAPSNENGYGDFTDIMGSGLVPSGHFNAMHKKRLNWFEAENWLAVTNSGTYRVYRSDHYQTTGVLRGLEIEKGVGDEYWVGLRQEQIGYEYFSRGAYVLWKQSGDNESNLLDMSPGSSGGKLDGGLALGQTYSDAAAQVRITPTLRGGQTPNEWMDITVNLGSFGGNSAPTASISGPTSGGVQESMLFSVTASDSDGDTLAYFWDTGDGLVKPNAPTLATAWLSGSTVTVSCVVSDMKGGTNKVSQTVVLASALDNWTQRTSGTTEHLRDITVGNGRLVVVGDTWQTYYSDDGINWNTVLKYNIYLEGVVYDGSQFIAAGRDTDSGWKGAIFTSSDGSSWTRRFIDGEYLNDIAYGAGVYVAVGKNGTIVRSTDGTSWSTNASGTSTDLKGVSYGDGTFVVVGDQGDSTAHVILTSTNGLSWSDYSSGSGNSGGQWMFDVEYVNDRFLAGGGYRSGIQHSTDQGETFLVGADDDYEMDGFAYGNGIYLATGVFVAPDRNTDINLISSDGVNWSEVSTVAKDNQNAVIAFNDTFITVGDNGSIWQSDAASASGGGFAAWQLENGAALGFNRDPLDDADFDGSLNLEEYARGTSASDAGSNPPDAIAEANGAYFQTSYERDGIKSDIDYSVERATNLASNDWSSASTVIVEDSATNLTVRSAYTLSSQTNEFMHLKLELK